ncbi:phage fiber-tail adaptor protein [Streptomyces rimosus]
MRCHLRVRERAVHRLRRCRQPRAVAADWTKGPYATLDWRWDWTDWLADGEVITASTMTASAGPSSSTSTRTAPSRWSAGQWCPASPARSSPRTRTRARHIATAAQATSMRSLRPISRTSGRPAGRCRAIRTATRVAQPAARTRPIRTS